MKKLSILTTLLFALGLYMVPATFATGATTDSKDKQSGQSEYQKETLSSPSQQEQQTFPGQLHEKDRQNQPSQTSQQDRQSQPGKLGQQSQQQNFMLVDHLIGSEIQDQQGEKIGDIDRVLVDVENGQVGFVTVTSGGVLGVGEDKYIVPFNALQIKMSQGKEAQAQAGERQLREVVFTLNTQKDQLKEVPQGDIEEALTQEDQSRGIFEHYGVAPYWEGDQRQQQRQDDTHRQMMQDKNKDQMMDKKDQQKNQ